MALALPGSWASSRNGIRLPSHVRFIIIPGAVPDSVFCGLSVLVLLTLVKLWFLRVCLLITFFSPFRRASCWRLSDGDEMGMGGADDVNGVGTESLYITSFSSEVRKYGRERDVQEGDVADM